MKRIGLEGPWRLLWREPGSGEHREVPAQVPGNVIGDLFRNGLIPDPFFGDNPGKIRKYESVDWEYRTVFRCPAPEAGEKLRLVFEGIDTVADIFVNGTRIGHAENMFVAHGFDLDLSLLRDENELTVRIRSSVGYARSLPPTPPGCWAQPYNFEGLRLRRAMHTYGWDIAPRLVGAGLWRKVFLEFLPGDRWLSPYLATTRLEEGSAELALAWSFVSEAPALEGFEAKLTLSCGKSLHTETFPLRFTTGLRLFRVETPLLWWPRGSGPQNLYDVTLELRHGGETVDTLAWRTGIRTVELIRNDVPDAPDRRNFHFRVNGKKIFIKGSNWVPADALHGENPERTLKSLALFAELGCNMIRCWGGNVYEDDAFFDWCDEHGLLVWQDFMFSCELAPQDEAFLDAVRREAETVVTALRNHPSLALWCGDNECDEIFFWIGLYRRHVPSENRISREILPRAVFQFDPARDYLASSPFRKDEVTRQNLPFLSPEQHLWGPRDYWKNPFYKDNRAVFASEIGYHGMPDVSSLRKFIPKEAWNDRRGAAWLCHGSQPFGESDGPYAGRIALMEKQTENFFGFVPEKLESFMISSQIVQAEAMKYFIELFRSKKWEKSGLVWWNAIDCWPQFSDAVTDYYHVRKLAFYYIKNAQQALSLIICDPEAGKCRLIADNARNTAVSGTFEVTDLMTGEIFAEGEFRMDPDAAGEIAAFPVIPGEQRMLLVEWVCGGKQFFNHGLLGDPPFAPEQYLQWLDRLDERIYRPLGRHEWRTEDY